MVLLFVVALAWAGPDWRSRLLSAATPIGADEALPNLDGTYRARDPQTSFQSNHISGLDDWREGLSQDQIAQLDALAGDWLTRYGLPR